MKINNFNLRILASLIVFMTINLSCLNCSTPSIKPGSNPLLDNDSDCGATQHLEVNGKITLQETNQLGTRLCEYTLTIHNKADEEIWFYIYQHNQDGYQNTEKYQWMGNFPIAPGEDAEWTGYIYIYTDKDASGPVMSIPERLAGLRLF